ncbi:unnamed protein product, partial [Symbiodinium natans]
VYAVMGGVEQEAIDAGRVLIKDNQSSQAADTIYVQDLALEDTTPLEQKNLSLSGHLSWSTSGPTMPAVGEDWAIVDTFDIYLAQGTQLSASERYIASVPITEAAFTFSAQLLSEGDDTILVYASNSVGKAPFGSVVQFGDHGGLQTTSTGSSTTTLTGISSLTTTSESSTTSMTLSTSSTTSISTTSLSLTSSATKTATFRTSTTS